MVHGDNADLAVEAAPVVWASVAPVDEQGWLRIPQRLREDAGVRDPVRAQASWGKVELRVEDSAARAGPAQRPADRLTPSEKRYSTEVAFDRVTKSYGKQERAVFEELTWRFDAEQLHVIAGPLAAARRPS